MVTYRAIQGGEIPVLYKYRKPDAKDLYRVQGYVDALLEKQVRKMIGRKMKEMNGMETAYAIREKNQNVDIVFITIMMDYALEGYRVDAVRYILKDDLESLLPECMDTILQKKQEKKMEFPFVGGKRKVLLKEILFIESKSHQLWFERIRENLYMYGQINDLELILSNYDFVRTHQSFLVNLVHIEKINNYLLYLSNGAEIPVTKQRYAKVKEQYLSYKEKM